MLTCTIVIFVFLSTVKSANILVVVPTPSLSHQIVFRPLVKELINVGHNVTIITTDPVYTRGQSPDNFNEINLHDLSYSLFAEWFKETAKIDETDFLSKLELVYRLLSKIFEQQLKDKTVQELLRDKTLKFDLLILESCSNPALIFSHIFKAPVIQMSSLGANLLNTEVIGTVTHPYLYPIQFHRRIYNLTILEKITEGYKHVMATRIYRKQEIKDDRMLQSLFGNNIPSLNELKNNVHMIFLNVHPIWIHNQPVPPNVVYTWGIHKNPKKNLPKDLQSYLDSSKNGVIYVSFGTNFKPSSMSAEKIKIFIKVFSLLPYNILWKWDTDDLTGKPENVKISKWFPQSDILRHPKVKLFITQGGLQSTEEAINAGVPLIGIPMFADQEYNAEKYVHFKIGIKLDFPLLSVEELKNAVNSIFIDYDRYHKNIIQLRTQMHDQPNPPLQNAIWWIEYVLRHGGARQLRSPASNMSWTEYYEIKLCMMVLCGVIVFAIVLILLVYSCFKSISQCTHLKTVKIKVL